MIKLEILNGSLQISIDSSIILVTPSNLCAIDVLALYDSTPYIFIYNKFLGVSTSIFNQPLLSCEDALGVPFDVSSFILFSQNFGFYENVNEPFEYNKNGTGIQPKTLGGVCSLGAFGTFSKISGGVYNMRANDYAVIGGGSSNNACCFSVINASIGSYAGNYSVIGAGTNGANCSDVILGGVQNIARNYSQIIGGYISSAEDGGIIIGGNHNIAARTTFIGGGKDNYSKNTISTILGGAVNTIIAGCVTNISHNTIAGGVLNCMVASAKYFNTINGGCFNKISAEIGSTINGGFFHLISGCSDSTIIGGSINNITGCNSTILGGRCNIASSTSFGTMLGGCRNTVSNRNSTIVGGKCNSSSGLYSILIGNAITSTRANTTIINNLSIMDIPTSSAGLPSKSVWSNGNVLTIVL